MEHFLCQVVFSWLPEAEGEMYATCFSWSLMVGVSVESCYMSFFEEATYHLCVSLGNSRTGESGTVWSLKKVVGGIFR